MAPRYAKDDARERLGGLVIRRHETPIRLDKHTHYVQPNGKTLCRILTVIENPLNRGAWIDAPRSRVATCGKCRRIFDSLVAFVG